MKNSNIKIVSGSASSLLSFKIANILDCEVVNVEQTIFPNGEQKIYIPEIKKVRNKIVFIIQSHSNPVDSNIIETLFLINSLKNIGAKQIHLISPWLGYSPQDKIFRQGESFSAQAICRLLDSSGIISFSTLDVHSDLVLQNFSIKTYNLSALPIFVSHFKDIINKDEWSVVALDKGAQNRSYEFAKHYNLEIITFSKTRDRVTGEIQFEKLDSVSNIENRNLVSFDDFISTGSTRIEGAKILKNMGAKMYIDYVTHLLVPETLVKIESSSIDKLCVSNSIELKFTNEEFSKLEVLSIESLIAEHIQKMCSIIF